MLDAEKREEGDGKENTPDYFTKGTAAAAVCLRKKEKERERENVEQMNEFVGKKCVCAHWVQASASCQTVGSDRRWKSKLGHVFRFA